MQRAQSRAGARQWHSHICSVARVPPEQRLPFGLCRCDQQETFALPKPSSRPEHPCQIPAASRTERAQPGLARLSLALQPGGRGQALCLSRDHSTGQGQGQGQVGSSSRAVASLPAADSPPLTTLQRVRRAGLGLAGVTGRLLKRYLYNGFHL